MADNRNTIKVMGMEDIGDFAKLEEIAGKVDNMCKHMALPYIRFTSIVRVLEGDEIELWCYIKDEDCGPIVVPYCEDTKEMVKRIKDKIHWQESISIKNVSTVETDLDIDPPKIFQIVGLPYRQIKVCCSGKESFVNLCQKSYQKVYSLLYEAGRKELIHEYQNEPPESIDFADLKKCLKRKELLVLLLSLS